MGSMTTLFCSTGVQRYVLDIPMSVRLSQFERLYAIIEGWRCSMWPFCEYQVADYRDDESVGTLQVMEDFGNCEVSHFCLF